MAAGQGISVGDAVLNFTANTQQLDEATAKLQNGLVRASDRAAKAVLNHAKAQADLKAAIGFAQIDKSTEAQLKLAEAQAKATVSAKALKDSQENLKRALGQVQQSTKDAKGGLELFGQLTGVQLPREVRSLVAELPVLNKAFSAALPAAAVLVIIDVLSQVPGKIRDVVNELAGWTDEAKRAFQAQLTLNQAYLKLEEDRQEAAIRAREIGKEGLALVQQQLVDDKELRDNAVKKREQAASAQRETLEAMNKELATQAALNIAGGQGLILDKLGITNRKEKLELLTKELEKAQQLAVAYQAEVNKLDTQIKQRAAQRDKQGLDDFLSLETAKIEATRKTADAQIQLIVAQGRVEYAERRITFEDLLLLEAAAAEGSFRIARNAVQEKLALAQRDPTRNREQIIALNAELESLAQQHQAKLLNDYAKTLAEFQKLEDAFLRELREKPATVEVTVTLPPVIEGVIALTEAMKTLGLETQKSMQDQVRHAESALEIVRQLHAEGRANEVDLADARRRVLELQIASAEQDIRGASLSGRVTKEQIANLRKLQKEYRDLTHVQATWGKVVVGISESAARAFQSTAEAYGAGAITIVGALGQILAATIRSIADIAFAKGTAQMAEGFASLAVYDYEGARNHFTSAGLWFLLGGALSVGAGLAGNLGRPGAQGGEQIAGTPIETTGGQAPVPAQPVRNIQRFAGGGVGNFGVPMGLISAPTMFIAGDSFNGGSQREAIIPLEDPAAVAQLRDSGFGGGTTVYVNIQGMISADHARKFVRNISKDVAGGKVRLSSSNSFRVTKRG
jgi:hypothetical protein